MIERTWWVLVLAQEVVACLLKLLVCSVPSFEIYSIDPVHDVVVTKVGKCSP